MQQYRVLLAERDTSDLDGIFTHIAKQSLETAGKVISRILKSIETPEALPPPQHYFASAQGSSATCAITSGAIVGGVLQGR
jgi:plasmid stabilization system protein ParE